MEGFQIIGFDWRYVYVNNAVAKQGKQQMNDLIGFSMMEIYPGIEKSEMFQVLKQCMEERTCAQIENQFEYLDGTKKWFELRVEPTEEGIIILSIDINNRKNSETELLDLKEQLENIVELRTSQLEHIRRNMLDSLNYAKNIQRAFLPKKSEVYELLPHSFLIYKPKDIISGDFYWVKEVNNKIIVAVADCTGHGVPGALMSIMGIEKLGQTVLRNRNASDILKHLNKNVKIALNQSNLLDNSHEGIEIALCTIDKETRKITFAGANRPLVLIRKSLQNLEEVSGTKLSIGCSTPDDTHFQSHEIQLEEGDSFYLFTDGYADQFGGEKDKKLSTKRFKQIIQEIQHLNMQEQEVYLKEFLLKWRGETEQIDDILVMGIRL
jgi:PAS domain S-box-containing protein